MEVINQSLKAGVAYRFPHTGRYFRMLSGVGNFKLVTDSNVRSDYVTGIGVDLISPEGHKFTWLELTSTIDQEISIVISENESTDSRLTGDVDINGGHTRNYSSLTIVANTATEILADNVLRQGANIIFNVAGRIAGDNTVSVTVGYPVAAGGQINDNNTSALWFYSTLAGTVEILEDLK